MTFRGARTGRIRLVSRPAAPLSTHVVGVADTANIAALNLDGRMVNIEGVVQVLRCLMKEFVTAARLHD